MNMKEYAKILQLFTMKQRFVVLLVLLVFGSGTYLIGTYFKSDDCSKLVAENRALLDDYVKLSAIIREMGKESAEKSRYTFDSTSTIPLDMSPTDIATASGPMADTVVFSPVPEKMDRREILLDSALQIVNKKSRLIKNTSFK